MKKRVAGGVVLVAIGIGIWLSNLFTGIGPGGAGTNVGANPDVAVSLQQSESAGGGTTSEVSATGGVPDGRPVVVIDGQEYFLESRADGATDYIPTTLDQIVEMATSAEPDADGIIVQIKRRGSSRQSAETALDTALREAGVTPEQIQRHAGLLE